MLRAKNVGILFFLLLQHRRARTYAALGLDEVYRFLAYQLPCLCAFLGMHKVDLECRTPCVHNATWHTYSKKLDDPVICRKLLNVLVVRSTEWCNKGRQELQVQADNHEDEMDVRGKRGLHH